MRRRPPLRSPCLPLTALYFLTHLPLALQQRGIKQIVGLGAHYLLRHIHLT